MRGWLALALVAACQLACGALAFSMEGRLTSPSAKGGGASRAACKASSAEATHGTGVQWRRLQTARWNVGDPPLAFGWRLWSQQRGRKSGFRCANGVSMSGSVGGGVTREGTNVLDGKAISQLVQDDVKQQAADIQNEFGTPPGLAVIIVGTRKDSQTYVRNKQRACEECGIASTKHELSELATQDQVLSLIEELNSDSSVHGILVQLPLPKHIDEQTVVGAVLSKKDVDGFHPENVGGLALRGREPAAMPCTPSGVMEMLRRAGVECRGKRAVVVGRSNIVGMPMSLMLMHEDATVLMAHSHTDKEDLIEALGRADIVVACAGQAEFIKGGWIKEGSVVIDVGMNAVDDDTKKLGYRLVGDVEFGIAKERASLITPVPGGVGPMTIAMLMKNTVSAARRQLEGKV